MSKYTGKTFQVDKPAAVIADKFADLTQLQEVVDKLPEDERSKIGKISFTTDSIAVNTAPVGDIRFVVVERNPHKVVMKAEGTPVPLKLDIDLDDKSADATDVTCSVDIDIPMMLKPMIGPQLQKAVNMLSEVMGKIMG